MSRLAHFPSSQKKESSPKMEFCFYQSWAQGTIKLSSKISLLLWTEEKENIKTSLAKVSFLFPNRAEYKKIYTLLHFAKVVSKPEGLWGGDGKYGKTKTARERRKIKIIRQGKVNAAAAVKIAQLLSSRFRNQTAKPRIFIGPSVLFLSFYFFRRRF